MEQWQCMSHGLLAQSMAWSTLLSQGQVVSLRPRAYNPFWQSVRATVGTLSQNELLFSQMSIDALCAWLMHLCCCSVL